MNILESLHSKISNNLSGSYPSKYNFIKCMKIIPINDIIKHDNYKRYDFITKLILLLIEKENLNKYYKWFDYETFRKYLKFIISNDQILLDRETYIKYCEYEQINSSKDVYIDNKISNFDYNNDK